MSAVKKAYRTVSSMNTGLILLFFIGLDTAVGSMVSPAAFPKTKVFQLLLVLLLLNMTLCTLNRAQGLLPALIKGRVSHRMLPRQIGILMLHLGIVLILIGGTVNTFGGQSRQISIIRGKTVNLSEKMRLPDPVSLTLNDFKIEVNDDGSPSQYYSYVTVGTKNRQPIKRVISVNHPLVIGKVKAYQDGFEYMVKVEPIADSGRQPARLMHEGDQLKIPGTKRIVKIYRYFPDFDPKGGMDQASMKPNNPRIVYSVYEDGDLLGVGAAKFGSKIKIDDQAYVIFHGVEPVTVLKVKTDPGLKVALAGALLLMLGVIMAIFQPPFQRGRKNPVAVN